MSQPVREAYSARNLLTGVVQTVKECAVMAEVVVELDGGAGRLTAIITTDSVEVYDIRPGKRVVARFKATETMIGLADSAPAGQAGPVPPVNPGA